MGKSVSALLLPLILLSLSYGSAQTSPAPQELEKKNQEAAARQEHQRRLESATVAFVQPGHVNSEREFNVQGADSSPAIVQGRYGRRGNKWFSFDVPVDSAAPMILVVTYTNDESQKRTFDVLAGGRKVGEQAIERRSPQQDIRFFDVEYPLPADLVNGKQKVTVRFEATNGNSIGAVLGIRMVRGALETKTKQTGSHD